MEYQATVYETSFGKNSPQLTLLYHQLGDIEQLGVWTVHGIICFTLL